MSFSGEFRFGFVALSDAAPLIVADRLGLFEAQGLRVALVREVSWASLRDKLAAGLLDGAHMLAQVVVAARLGAGGFEAELIAPLALNANGAAVTLSRRLLDEAASLAGGAAGPPTGALAAVVEARRRAAAPPLAFGAVFPFSIHAYLLRRWLAEGGIDPDRDVRLLTLPPTAMARRMAAGELDGFAVGAPWSAVAEAQGIGRTVVRCDQLDPRGSDRLGPDRLEPDRLGPDRLGPASLGPDKVFAVGQGWAARNGGALSAALRALHQAALWADEASNRAELVAMLAAPDAVGADPAAIAAAFSGPGATRLTFARGGLGRPDPRHARVILAQMRRWGQVGASADPAVAEAAFRPDLFDLAQRPATLDLPAG